MGNIWATQKDFGGLKWLFVICSACASQVVDPFFARTLTGGGLKWLFVICSANASQVADPFSPKSLAWFWWAQMDSNHRPHAYQACALTSWAMSPFFKPIKVLVEASGIEPLTPCLQGRCSTSWAMPPLQLFKAALRQTQYFRCIDRLQNKCS